MVLIWGQSFFIKGGQAVQRRLHHGRESAQSCRPDTDHDGAELEPGLTLHLSCAACPGLHVLCPVSFLTLDVSSLDYVIVSFVLF